ncbi:MAG: MucBP domain-containing protein [Lachnospiraceae bacterium]|nr:MucBP domain-containing protein [Lachnospiraceae bacterium]
MEVSYLSKRGLKRLLAWLMIFVIVLCIPCIPKMQNAKAATNVILELGLSVGGFDVLSTEVSLRYDSTNFEATGSYTFPAEVTVNGNEAFPYGSYSIMDAVLGNYPINITESNVDYDNGYAGGDTWDIQLMISPDNAQQISEGLHIGHASFYVNTAQYKNIVTLNYYDQGDYDAVFATDTVKQSSPNATEYVFNIISSEPTTEDGKFIAWKPYLSEQTTEAYSSDSSKGNTQYRASSASPTWTVTSSSWYDESTTEPSSASVSLYARYGHYMNVKYVDDQGEEIRTADQTLYEDGSYFEIEVPEIDGFEAPELNEDERYGYMEGGSQTLTLTYLPYEYELTTRFVDEDGNTLAEEQRTQVKCNRSYQTTPVEVTGYSVKTTPDNASGKMPASNTTVTYVYQKNKYTATVKYLNEEGKKIQDNKTQEIEYGASYSIEKENVAGYILKETPDNAKGTMPAKDITVKFIYKPRTYNITYDLNGGTLSKSNPSTYTVESDKITLNNPERENYTFTGWTGSNGDNPDTSVSIKKGSTGDKKYKANWEEDPDSNVSGEGGTKSLKKGKKNRMGSGRWSITGDATIYNGDSDFYVPEDISLTFNAVQ